MAAEETDRQTKIEHPEEAFARPDDVLKDTTLSTEEKKRALANWRRDAVGEITAADEGMPAPEGEIANVDRELQEVAAAQRRLESGEAS